MPLSPGQHLDLRSASTFEGAPEGGLQNEGMPFTALLLQLKRDVYCHLPGLNGQALNLCNSFQTGLQEGGRDRFCDNDKLFFFFFNLLCTVFCLHVYLHARRGH